MANGTKICKICGKEYPYCKSALKEDPFRWQDVACCPEHGSQYFADVIAERERPRKEAEQANAPKEEIKEDFYDQDEEEEEEDIFGDDDEDEEADDEDLF